VLGLSYKEDRLYNNLPNSAPSLTSLPIHQSLLYFSLICKKSLALKEIAHPCTGASSSIVPSKSIFVWTAKSTGLYCV